VSRLIDEITARGVRMGLPITVHMDVTYRCNERCDHCYLDHDDHGEMTTAEIKRVLAQLAAAGTFFLVLSGGEVFMRQDFFEILEYARRLQFDVNVKTNAVMIREAEARRLRSLGVRRFQVSIYSDDPAVHDGITRLPGSLQRSLRAMRFLKEQGMYVTLANVLMRQNMHDYAGTQRLAREMGIDFALDPTITPMMDGSTAPLTLRIPTERLQEVYRDASLGPIGSEACGSDDEDVQGTASCSAGHASCYISPYGDVYPCVQFPMPCGNLRHPTFQEIWGDSPQLAELRTIRVRDLPSCSSCGNVGSCSRCPGLAYMEGNMRGPSTADCEKSYARTGHASVNLLAKMNNAATTASPKLVQIQL